MNEAIYLDYNATTPVLPDVLEAMMPWLSQQFWNSASSHAGGRRAAGAVDNSREEIAALVGASPREMIFTSGATEANNLAIIGGFRAADSKRRRVVIGATEHRAVLDPAEWLGARGADVVMAPVDRCGLIDLDVLREWLDESVALVSIMLANNETGIIASVTELAEVAHEFGALFHTDATQAVGKIPADFRSMNVDMASISAHKLYGPKGVGALFLSHGTEIDPLLLGGGHERGIRSGTLNVPGIVGFGSAASLAANAPLSEAGRQAELIAILFDRLVQSLDGVELIGASTRRLPNTASIRFHGATGDAVMANAPDIMISSGSACSSMIPEPSHVLLAMGLDALAAEECLRFSVGRPTQPSDVEQAATQIAKAVNRVREIESLGGE